MKYEQYFKDNRELLEQMRIYGERYCAIKAQLSEISYQGDYVSFKYLKPYLNWEEDSIDLIFYDDRLEVGYDDDFMSIFISFEADFFDITEETADDYFLVLDSKVNEEKDKLIAVKVQAEEDLKAQNAKNQESREFEEYKRLHKKFGNQRN